MKSSDLWLWLRYRRLSDQEKDKAEAKRHKAVCKALGYLENNSRHPALSTHEFSSLQGPNGEKVFEAYAENLLLHSASSGTLVPAGM